MVRVVTFLEVQILLMATKVVRAFWILFLCISLDTLRVFFFHIWTVYQCVELENVIVVPGNR